MKIIDIYIGRYVISYMLVTAMALIGIQLITSIIGELDDVGRGRYDLSAALRYLAFMVPSRLYELAPMAILIGSLMGLGGMAANQEVVAVRAAGMSITRIIISALFAAVSIALLIMAMGEWVVPRSELYARQFRANLMSETPTQLTRSGAWTKEANRFIYIDKISPDGTLSEITVFAVVDNRLQEKITAQQAKRDGEGRWVLSDLERTVIKSDEIAHQPIESENWDSLINQTVLDLPTLKPERHSLGFLWQNVEHLKENGLQSARYEQALWAKVAMPFATIAMLLVALPTVFGPQRDSSAGQRVFFGSVIGIGFFLLNNFLTHAGRLMALHASVSAFLAVAVFSLIAWYQMRRYH